MTSQQPAVEPGAGRDAGPTFAHAYDAFLSYSNRTDYSTARKVEAFLEGFHKEVPREETSVRRLQVCRDGSDFKLPEPASGSISVGDDPIWQIIVGELSRARYLLVLCSPGAAGSRWVAREVEWMLAKGDPSRILLALTECEDPVGNPAACFPAQVIERGIHASRIWYDLRGLRRGGRRDARDARDELVRLATDLLDWDSAARGPLSAVFEREQRRRRRTRLAATLGAALLLTVSVVAAVNWWRAADREGRKAESRRLALNALVQIDKDSELSLLLADEAWRKWPTQEAEEALRQTLLRSRSKAVLRLPPRRVGDESLPAHVASADIGRDGRYAVIADADGPAKVWDVAEGREKFALVEDASCYKTAFSPDGLRIVTASLGRGGGVRVWDAADGRLRFELADAHGDWAEFSTDGTLVVTAGFDGQSVAKLWDAEDGAFVTDIRAEGRGFKIATLSPDKQLLVTVADSKDSVRPQVWDVRTRSLVRELEGHIDSVWSAAFNPAGGRLVTAGADRTAIVWDVKTGEKLASLSGYVEISKAAFSPDGLTLVTAGEQEVMVWDAGSGRRLAALRGHESRTSGAAFSRDGGQILTWGHDGTVRVWWASLDGEREQLNAFEHPGVVHSVAFSPDGRRLLTTCGDESARVWDVETRGLIWKTPEQPALLMAAAFSGDRLFKTLSGGGEIAFWDVESRVSLRVEAIPRKSKIERAVFSPGARRVATLDSDRTARVWDAETGSLIKEFSPGENPWSESTEDKFVRMSFSPDGKLLATANDARRAQIWEIETGKKVLELPTNGVALNVSFSPDGASLAITDGGGTATLWSLSSAALGQVLRGHSGAAHDAAFSPDGKLVVTAWESGTGAVWELSSGERLMTLRAGKDWINGVAFNRDGSLVVTAGGDREAGRRGKARLFACEVCGPGDALASLARRRVTRELTAAERRKFSLE